MTKAELREERIWLVHHMILQWVKNGMTLEEAKQTYEEINSVK